MKQAQSINQIIGSFEHYGLGDVKHNKTKTIAALILGICFIDQLASFRYNGIYKRNNAARWEKFVSVYMPVYKGLNIYSGFRNSLIHSYSGGYDYGTSNDENVIDPHFDHYGLRVINTNAFIIEIEKAFELYKTELLNVGSESNKNATEWSIENPVLVHNKVDLSPLEQSQ